MTIRFRVVAGFVLLVMASGASAHGRKPDRRKNGQQLERTMAADPRVLVSTCVMSGNLTVRGWDRNEVRARTTDGTQVDFARNDQTNDQSKAATELRVTANGRHGIHSNSSCVSSADIELDVPRAASLKLQTSSGDIRVTEVARVDVSSQSGSIALDRVHSGANVNTISGDISVHDSSGSFNLHAVSGSVEARNLVSAGTDEGFAAATVGGEVMLDHVQIQTIKVNTVSGDIGYAGPLSRGGRYNFHSISGQMRLSLPNNSSFRLSASLGAVVKFSCDFTLNYSDNQNTTGVSNRGGFRRIEATAGSGDSSITVLLLEGSLQISKR
jgi:DUF4097 and DUF4098 domain-containing protein YvlB